MNKSGKIIFSVFIFAAVLAGPIFAQGYPVLDVANLMQAINTLYATYDQITATIEQVQNTYQQLQKQIEMVQNMDWDKIGEKISDMDVTSIDGLLNLRHQIKDVTRLVNHNMNLVNNVQDTLTKKTVTFGGRNTPSAACSVSGPEARGRPSLICRKMSPIMCRRPGTTWWPDTPVN